jgi:hypothetical protein
VSTTLVSGLVAVGFGGHVAGLPGCVGNGPDYEAGVAAVDAGQDVVEV